jgi:hypothetical protein
LQQNQLVALLILRFTLTVNMKFNMLFPLENLK